MYIYRCRLGQDLALGDVGGLRNTPKGDTKMSIVEVLYGTTLRIPCMCFTRTETGNVLTEEQLKNTRANVESFTSAVLNQMKFKQTPFISKDLTKAKYIFVRERSLAKSALSSRYVGLYPVVSQDWKKSTLRLQFPQEARQCINRAAQGRIFGAIMTRGRYLLRPSL